MINSKNLEEISKINDCRELLLSEGEMLLENGDSKEALILGEASKILGAKIELLNNT